MDLFNIVSHLIPRRGLTGWPVPLRRWQRARRTTCRFCAKRIRVEASVCRFCHRVLSATPAPVDDITYG